MSNLDNSTGFQNLIFKLMENFGTRNQPGPGQNPENINPNILNQGQNGINMGGQFINPINQMFGQNPFPFPIFPFGPMFPHFFPVSTCQPVFQPQSSISPIMPQLKGLSVIFRTSSEVGEPSPPITVQCMPDEKVSDMIKKYRNKANDYDKTKQFIFNGKRISPNLTLAEQGIINNANIYVLSTGGVHGGYESKIKYFI